MKKTVMTREMTVREIKETAETARYEAVTYLKGEELFLKIVSCPKCKDEGTMLAFRAIDKTNPTYTVHACTCGCRVMYIKNNYCKKTPDKKNNEPTPVCATCGGPLPKGRKKWCYNCKSAPASKQEGQSGSAY